MARPISETTKAVFEVLDTHGDLTFTEAQPHLKVNIDATQFNGIKQAWKRKGVVAHPNQPVTQPAEPAVSVEAAFAFVAAHGGLAKARAFVEQQQALLARANEIAALMS